MLLGEDYYYTEQALGCGVPRLLTVEPKGGFRDQPGWPGDGVTSLVPVSGSPRSRAQAREACTLGQVSRS